MKQGAALLTSLICIATGAWAHPHSQVDQQVQLIFTLDQIKANITIVPAGASGADIFAQLDTDGDGALSAAETSAVGARVLPDLAGDFDSTPLVFTVDEVKISDRATFLATHGKITISASAGYDPQPPSAHTARFDITFGEFAHDWFVQPYFQQDLADQMSPPQVVRSDTTDAVTVLFSH